jgi:hypothetical protein
VANAATLLARLAILKLLRHRRLSVAFVFSELDLIEHLILNQSLSRFQTYWNVF